MSAADSSFTHFEKITTLALPGLSTAAELQETAKDLANIVIDGTELHQEQAKALAAVKESPQQFALAVIDYVFRFPDTLDENKTRFSFMKSSPDLAELVSNVLRADDLNLDFKELVLGLKRSLKDKVTEPLVEYIKDLYKNLYKNMALLQFKIEKEDREINNNEESDDISRRHAALLELDKIMPAKFGHRVVADACEELCLNDPLLSVQESKKLDLLKQQIQTGHKLMHSSFPQQVKLWPRVGKLSLQELWT